VAVPLHREGVEVHGIDASEAMLARLRTKEGAASIATSVADIRDFKLEPRFTLAYVVFNTLFALRTQDDQVMCFQAARPGPRRRLSEAVPRTRFDCGRAGASGVDDQARDLTMTRSAAHREPLPRHRRVGSACTGQDPRPGRGARSQAPRGFALASDGPIGTGPGSEHEPKTSPSGA
jgi:hypothetical protein